MLTLYDSYLSHNACKITLLPARLNLLTQLYRSTRRRLNPVSRIERVADRFRLVLSYNRNINELKSLDDKLISDMGINRGDIPMLAKRAAIRDRISRTRHRRIRRSNSTD